MFYRWRALRHILRAEMNRSDVEKLRFQDQRKYPLHCECAQRLTLSTILLKAKIQHL